MRDQAADAVEQARRGAKTAAGAMRDTAASMSGAVAASASSMGGALADTAGRTRRQAADVVRQSRDSAASFVTEQPLLCAAIGVAIGAALASLLPSTETEDRLMGEASDAVKGDGRPGRLRRGAKARRTWRARRRTERRRRSKEEGLSPERRRRRPRAISARHPAGLGGRRGTGDDRDGATGRRLRVRPPLNEGGGDPGRPERRRVCGRSWPMEAVLGSRQHSPVWHGDERRRPSAPVRRAGPAGGATGTTGYQLSDASRAQEQGRGRHAAAPWDIPWRGWKDILWRTYAKINDNRLMSVAAGVVFYWPAGPLSRDRRLRVALRACSPTHPRSTRRCRRCPGCCREARSTSCTRS